MYYTTKYLLESTMSSRIYQSYYKPEQKEHLDPEFYPYDNTSNPVNNLYELYLYHRIREISIQDGIERWGMFSWQWRNKIKYKLDASSIVHTANQDEHDICLFNAYPDDELISYNVWEQGAWSHPYIVYLGQEVLTEMGEDPDLVKMPMTRSIYLAANYFVANRRFWDGLLLFLDRFAEALARLAPGTKRILHSSAGYAPNPALDYTGFLCERMISTYLVRNMVSKGKEDGYEFVIAAWTPGEHYIGKLKEKGIKDKDRALLLRWNDERTPFLRGPKLATDWINHVFPPVIPGAMDKMPWE
jgi:hypothetical protein